MIENALKRWPDSPSLRHLYIHVMEMSQTPEKFLDAAETPQQLAC